MGKLIKANKIIKPYLKTITEEVKNLPPIQLVGILSNNSPASQTYSNYTAKYCTKIGINYKQVKTTPEQTSQQINHYNNDPNTHGIIVYYPIFGGARDRTLQDEITPNKDAEGLSTYWTSKLYHNIRTINNHKAILPCTPLGIIKALNHTNTQIKGTTITIFNRSEVVGRPLAAMLSHDGAKVISYDINGPQLYHNGKIQPTDINRTQALKESQIIITGVPSKEFKPIQANEINEGTTAINFSHINNLNEDIQTKANVITRVGPLTITMLLRNTLRLVKNYEKT